MRNLVSSFFLLLGFVFGGIAVEFGISTEANPPQKDNDSVTETVTDIHIETNLPKIDSDTVKEALVPARKLPPELRDIIIPVGYNNKHRALFSDPQIGLRLFVTNIAFLEEQAKVNVSLEVLIRWTDARLKLDPNSNLPDDGYVNAPLTALEHIWHPSTEIMGLGTSDPYFMKNISFNRAHKLSWMSWNRTECVGCVRFMRETRVTIQLHADMHFTFFPNDKHMATLSIAPDNLFHKIPVRHAIVFFLNKAYKDDDTFDIKVASTAFTDGLHKIFIPSGFFVVLIILSMLLPAEVAGDRVALCATSATTLLTVTVFFNTAASSGKAVSYLRAIDIWLLGCTSFVFLILFQSVIIFRLVTAKNLEKRNQKNAGTRDMKQALRSLSMQLEQMQDKLGGPDSPQESAPSEPTPQDVDLENKAQDLLDKDEDKSHRVTKIAEMIDRISLITFVIILAACNGIYWNWLLNSVQQACPWDGQCRLRLVDTDDYRKAKAFKDLLNRFWNF